MIHSRAHSSSVNHCASPKVRAAPDASVTATLPCRIQVRLPGSDSRAPIKMAMARPPNSWEAVMLRRPLIAVLIALLAAAPAAAEIARIKQSSGAAVVQRGAQQLKPAPGLPLLAGDS